MFNNLAKEITIVMKMKTMMLTSKIELEEALESDVDEAYGCGTEQSKGKTERACVPETRQKKPKGING
ncbi:hypothetical protein HPP92_024766 [Vanilla planifolia]|uniref:Uncharacterized protein n=1 Tax=Vanilla planifolia TaxID=51239 RepID=A0A835PJ82_VANPL|nr:hypothetical protein HPP92_025067 [Vanilla planifolia]KAG0453462.1 hypothetical protein HPP92_024766 [Vanilla planifolia]